MRTASLPHRGDNNNIVTTLETNNRHGATRLTQVRHIPAALGLVWGAAPFLTSVTVAILAIQGLLPVAIVYLTRSLVNSLTVLVNHSAEGISLAPTITGASLMGLVVLLAEVLSSVAGYVRTALAERMKCHMNDLVQTKAISVDLSFYESSAYYDQLHRAREAIERPLALLEGLGGLVQNAITLIAMSGILFTFAWWMPLVLVVGTMPALWVALNSTWQLHKWRLRNTSNQRRLSYLNDLLSFDGAAAELRLFALGPHFSKQYKTLWKRLYNEQLQLSRRQMAAQIAAGFIGLLILSTALIWVGWQTVQGMYNLGELAMFYQALNQGQRLMHSLLADAGDIYRNLLFLEDLLVFLYLKPQITDPAEPARMEPTLNQGIDITDVTFAYPGGGSAALKDFSLNIPAGQIAAIVGENGAGKSTLLKLLCRFYDPQQGRIAWDGADLRRLPLADLRRRITVLFQQPVPYHETAAGNVRLGDLASQPSQARIEAAVRAGGAQEIINKLPEGYETVLGKFFGYTELSVGEWQRLALARAFLRQADLVILDEPTSAMDSWAEATWMTRFRGLVNGRTALIITHRFTTAMQADVIHVIHEGRVVESGAHSELVALGGRYAASWQTQMHENSHCK